MTIMKLLLSLSLLILANTAIAADYDIGALTTGYTQFGPNAVNGSFLDKIYFSVPANSGIGIGVDQLSFSIWGINQLNISNLSKSLFTSNNSLIISGLNFALPPLATGNYYLQITGNGNGVAGGLYAGAIGITPVPEPDIASSMIAGLVIAGFMVYRRRNSI